MTVSHHDDKFKKIARAKSGAAPMASTDASQTQTTPDLLVSLINPRFANRLKIRLSRL